MGKMKSSLAKSKKLLGHAEETTFNAFFGDTKHRENNFSGSFEDNVVTNKDYQTQLKKVLGSIESFTVSLKSGDTWQFHLGRIDELSNLDKIIIRKNSKGETRITHPISFDKQQSILKKKSFWKKYLGKGELLCYNDKHKMYTFFKMTDIIDFIIKNSSWSLLASGRIKGSLQLNSKNYNIITFEYRSDKRLFVLGAHGGKNGIRLFEILKENLKYAEITFESETKHKSKFSIEKKKITKYSTGKIGEVFFNEEYVFICVATNKWKRIKFNVW
jgi:hypothetical protein